MHIFNEVEQSARQLTGGCVSALTVGTDEDSVSCNNSPAAERRETETEEGVSLEGPSKEVCLPMAPVTAAAHGSLKPRELSAGPGTLPVPPSGSTCPSQM